MIAWKRNWIKALVVAILNLFVICWVQREAAEQLSFLRLQQRETEEGTDLPTTMLITTKRAAKLDAPYDICIAGAGLSGAVLAERYASIGRQVLVVEKRDHIGGNCYDYIDPDTGIRISRYGAHLFHTKYESVWQYVQRFGQWTPYEHKVRGIVNGKLVPIPVNIETVNMLFDLNMQTSKEMDEWLKEEQVTFPGEPQNSEQVALSRVGRRLYEWIFKPYTVKQWNKDPAELGPEVLARIPVRNNWDDGYFDDPHQALPADGYTSLFARMLASPHITVRTSTDFFDVRDTVRCDHIYFTGPIDAYYASLGWPKLEYRSLDFERHVEYNTDFFQPHFVVNHPQDTDDYTRIVEYKHLLNQTSKHTVYFIERSKDGGEPYYPVPNQENKDLYLRYQEMAAKEEGVTFVGRLANYKYFNMDQAIKNALDLFAEDSSVAEQQEVQPTDKGYVQASSMETYPDWMLVTKCSAYSAIDCVLHETRQRNYSEYPFRFEEQLKELEGIVKYEELSRIPDNWAESLHSPIAKVNDTSVPFVYPNRVPQSEIDQCIRQASEYSWKKQIKRLLSSGRVTREGETQMISFTLTDFKYAVDMVHDVFEMTNELVGFSASFFMVALDKDTVELACEFGYPVVAWTAGLEGGDSDLKAAVGNAKFEVSHELVRLGESLFFFEMDVWFIRSPKTLLQRFLASENGMVYSSHQNCPSCGNIGLYAAKANNGTEEFFRVAAELAKQSPDTHDQRVMMDLADVAHNAKLKRVYRFSTFWKDPVPKPPLLQYPFTYSLFGEQYFTADVLPVPTEHTVAIHTLCGAPLQSPHGKKMMAKEVGAWYGFKGPAGEAGYYARTGDNRRYLWMDGHSLGGYSTQMHWAIEKRDVKLFHNAKALRWTIAALVALARRTNRIFVLPRLLLDHWTSYLWTILDLKSVEDLVQVRETNFPSNPKSWYNKTTPFRTVARTALGTDGVLFAQFPQDGDEIHGWKVGQRSKSTALSSDQVDAWWALHTALPQVDEAELLLTNPRFIQYQVDKLAQRASLDNNNNNSNNNNESWGTALGEIAQVYSRLRWCAEDALKLDMVSNTLADHDCYGKGRHIGLEDGKFVEE